MFYSIAIKKDYFYYAIFFAFFKNNSFLLNALFLIAISAMVKYELKQGIEIDIFSMFFILVIENLINIGICISPITDGGLDIKHIM